MKTPYELFLEALGFTDVKQIKSSGVIELYVGQGLKATRKAFKKAKIKFSQISKGTTPTSQVEEFYAVENKRVVGRVKVNAYATHTIIQLSNIEHQS